MYFCRKRRRYLCRVVISSDISHNWNVSNILVEAPYTKSHDNPFGGSRVVPREQMNGWTDVTKTSPLSLTSIIVLCFNLNEVLPSRLLPSSPPIKTLYSFLSQACRITQLPHPASFSLPISIWRAVQIMTCITVQFSAACCYFRLLRQKCLLQNAVLISLCFFLSSLL